MGLISLPTFNPGDWVNCNILSTTRGSLEKDISYTKRLSSYYLGKTFKNPRPKGIGLDIDRNNKISKGVGFIADWFEMYIVKNGVFEGTAYTPYKDLTFSCKHRSGPH